MLAKLTTILFSSDTYVPDQAILNMISSDSSSVLDWLKDIVVQFITWFMIGLISILSPIVTWGGASIIVVCYVSHYVSGDSKSIATGLKVFFIMIVFFMIEGVFIK